MKRHTCFSLCLLMLLCAGMNFACLKKQQDIAITESDEGAAGILRQIPIFPAIDLHTHGASIVELPNGDLLSAWFQGSGERWADDVAIMGARLPKGDTSWSSAFVLADVPEFPDVNPVLFLDGRERLWLCWYTVLSNMWETSLPKYRISENYMMAEGPPEWSWQEVLHVKPGGSSERGIQPGDPFVISVQQQMAAYEGYLKDTLKASPEIWEGWEKWSEEKFAVASGETYPYNGYAYQEDGSHVRQLMGYPLFRRIGWQTKNKAILIDGKRIVLPLYSDGLGFSLMAITDDEGETWQYSQPLVGFENIQASTAIKRDGTLVTYMRDNGPPPQRLQMSSSTDKGMTWSPVRDAELPNPGSGADILTLVNGNWVIAYNDTEDGRHSLAISLSEDEGQHWTYTRHLVLDESGKGAATGAYPSIIQGQNGGIHVVYSYVATGGDGIRKETIRYARFDEAWIRKDE